MIEPVGIHSGIRQARLPVARPCVARAASGHDFLGSAGSSVDPQRAGPRRRCPGRQRQRRVSDGPGIQAGRGGGALPANLGPDPRMLRQPRRVQATVFRTSSSVPGTDHPHWLQIRRRMVPPRPAGNLRPARIRDCRGPPLEPPLSRPPGLPGLGKPVPTERPGPSHRERDDDKSSTTPGNHHVQPEHRRNELNTAVEIASEHAMTECRQDGPQCGIVRRRPRLTADQNLPVCLQPGLMLKQRRQCWASPDRTLPALP